MTIALFKLRGWTLGCRLCRGKSKELFDGDGFNFFVCRMALQDFMNAVLYERRHPFLEGGFQHLFGACLLLDHSLASSADSNARSRLISDFRRARAR